MMATAQTRRTFLHSRRHSERFVKRFCINIRMLRRRLHLRQGEAAQRAGISRQQWSTLERGLQAPNLETVTRIADALGVDIVDLLT